MRGDVYNKIMAFNKMSSLGKQDAKFIDKVLNEYIRMGIKLNSQDKLLILKIKNRINKIQSILQHNINNNINKIQLSFEELKGLPDDTLNSLNKIGHKFEISLEPHMYCVCMKNIVDPDIRQKIEYAYNTRCIDDLRLFLELIILRDKLGQMLGYQNYSGYKTHNMIASNPKNVKTFLLDFLSKLDNVFTHDVKNMIKLKRQEYKSNVIEDFEELINSWDIPYYTEQLKKKKYHIDEDQIKIYFPIDQTIQNIISIYESMMNVQVININDNNQGECNVWHPSVGIYKVMDLKTDRIIGYFYLDLLPRQGKYNQTACFHLKSPCMYPFNSNNYQLPVTTLITNFTEKYLKHGDVITLFHEFSHIFHHILGKGKYGILSGTNVEQDFVEIPALMLENYCWSYPGLRKIASSHPVNNHHISRDLVDKMNEVRNVCMGVHYKRQLLLAIFDQLVHSKTKFIDIAKNLVKQDNVNIEISMSAFFKKFSEEILSPSDVRDKYVHTIGHNIGTFMPISWHFLFTNQAGLYYSYIWSDVHSIDMYLSTGVKDMDEIGKKLKNDVYQYGGSVDGIQLLVNYLGRQPSNRNFFEFKNIKPKQDHKKESSLFCRYLTSSRVECEISSSESSSDMEDSVCPHNNETADSYITENTESLAKYSDLFIIK
jgi:Zn-dependent oligopeptidase